MREDYNTSLVEFWCDLNISHGFQEAVDNFVFENKIEIQTSFFFFALCESTRSRNMRAYLCNIVQCGV